MVQCGARDGYTFAEYWWDGVRLQGGHDCDYRMVANPNGFIIEGDYKYSMGKVKVVGNLNEYEDYLYSIIRSPK